MSASAYRLSVSGVSKAVEAYTFQVLARLTTTTLSQKQWLGLILALFPHIRDGRAKTLALAADFYEKERQKHAVKIPFDAKAINISTYTPLATERALQPVKAFLTGLDKLKSQEQKLVAATQASRLSAVHVEQGARDGLVAMSKADDAALGWARIDPQPPSCAFCLTLISRGPVYKHGPVEVNGLSSASYHPNDTCISVPVFSKTGWPGEQQFKEARKSYRAASARVGGDPRQVINELRKS